MGDARVLTLRQTGGRRRGAEGYVDAEDNKHLREQQRALTSDLNAVQSLVENLTAENTRLVRENEMLDRENLSVLAGIQLNQRRRKVDTHGGHAR